MNGTTHTIRLATAIVLAASLAALAVPAAPAGGRPSYGPPDGWYTYAVSLTKSTRTGASQAQPTAVGRILAQERARQYDPRLCGGLAACSSELPRRIVAAIPTTGRQGGFDWADAGIGAGGAFGLALLLGGAALAVKRNRQNRLAGA